MEGVGRERRRGKRWKMRKGNDGRGDRGIRERRRKEGDEERKEGDGDEEEEERI